MTLQHIVFDHGPGLAISLQKAPSSARGQFGAAMPGAALEASGVADAVADRGLRAIEAGVGVPQTDLEWSHRRAAGIDEAYLDRADELGDDESREREVLGRFWRAR